MVESLKDLNKIVQKPNYKTTGNWMVRHILRDAALPITWLLLHTNVTANQVTLGALIIGMLGVAMLAIPGTGFFFMACLLLQLWYLLDHVDGQIARYHKTAGLSGRFFDFLMHHLIHGSFFFALGFYFYNCVNNAGFILLGFVSSLAVMAFNMMHDIRCKALIEKMGSYAHLEIKKGEAPSSPAKKEGKAALFSALHKVAEFHVVMNLFTAAALLQVFFKPAFDWRVLLFVFYFPVTLLLPVVKITYWIKNRTLDSEFDQKFTGTEA